MKNIIFWSEEQIWNMIFNKMALRVFDTTWHGVASCHSFPSRRRRRIDALLKPRGVYPFSSRTYESVTASLKPEFIH